MCLFNLPCRSVRGGWRRLNGGESTDRSCARRHAMPARHLFGFGDLHLHDVALTIAAGVAVLICLETGKRLIAARIDR